MGKFIKGLLSVGLVFATLPHRAAYADCDFGCQTMHEEEARRSACESQGGRYDGATRTCTHSGPSGSGSSSSCGFLCALGPVIVGGAIYCYNYPESCGFGSGKNPGSEASGFSGTWVSKAYGDLELRTRGKSVIGTYEYEGPNGLTFGHVVGTVEGGQFSYKWWEATSKDISYDSAKYFGDGYMRITASGNQIDGQFRSAGGTWMNWSLTRK